MQRIIILLIVVPFLFACDVNNSSNDETNENQNKVVATLTDSSATITFTTDDFKTDSTILEVNPDEAKPVTGIVSKSGKTKVDRGTIEDEEEALKLRRARTQFTNGITYYKDGDLDQAIEAFKLALEFKPDNDKVFYNLGRIYYDLGQKELSMSYYKDAVRLNPSDSLSLVAIGLLYYEQGDFVEATKFYDSTIAVAQHFSMVYFNRGTMFGQQKMYQKSLQDLNKAIEYDDKNSEAFINRGLAHYFLKQMDLACKDWHKAAAMGNPKGTRAVDIYCSGVVKKQSK
jgi:tetratricopeptide (TPR) repeat protein|tara:strand:- start:126 stop:983 length:858 start_codon:yes stop_codon:yes gene_type:complete